jgi:hypothetical protein
MPDDAATVLLRALEDASRLRRENAELRQNTQRTTQQMFGEAGARISAQDTAIDSQIAAFEAQGSAARAEYERLLTEGDFKGATAANDRIIESTTRIASLRDQKERLVMQRHDLEQRQTQQPTNPQPSNQNDPLAGLNERERQWVAEHPAYLSDPDFAQRARNAAGYAANNLRLARDSDQYIDFINRSVSGQQAASISIPADDFTGDAGGGDGNPNVAIPQMPIPETPRPVAVNPNDDLSNEMQMVDQMYPQQRAVGRGGQGISSVAAPPRRVIRELSNQLQRGRNIEPTVEELETARIIIPQILGAEGAAMSDEDKIRTYFTWNESPASKRKLRRWYGRDAA